MYSTNKLSCQWNNTREQKHSQRICEEDYEITKKKHFYENTIIIFFALSRLRYASVSFAVFYTCAQLFLYRFPNTPDTVFNRQNPNKPTNERNWWEQQSTTTPPQNKHYFIYCCFFFSFLLDFTFTHFFSFSNSKGSPVKLSLLHLRLDVFFV